MIITEQRIKEIILEELLLEKQLLHEKKITDYINKFFNQIKNVIKNNKSKQDPNSPFNIALRNWTNEYQKLLINNPNISREEAKQFNRQQAREIGMPEKEIDIILNGLPPPPPPEDEEEPEEIGAKDIAPDEESTKSASKFSKLAQQVAGNNKDKQKQIEALLTFLEKGGHLKPEALKKLGLSESIIKKFYGNNDMSINKKVLKRIIKEEMEKARTNEAFGRFKGVMGAVKSAASGEMSGGKEGKYPDEVKNKLSKISFQSKALSDDILNTVNSAKKANLAASKELAIVLQKLSGLNQASNKLVSDKSQLLVAKNSPDATPEQSIQADGTGGIDGEAISAGPTVGPTGYTTTAGGPSQQVGGSGVGDISPAGEKAETEKIRANGGITGDVSGKKEQETDTANKPAEAKPAETKPEEKKASSDQAPSTSTKKTPEEINGFVKMMFNPVNKNRLKLTTAPTDEEINKVVTYLIQKNKLMLENVSGAMNMQASMIATDTGVDRAKVLDIIKVFNAAKGTLPQIKPLNSQSAATASAPTKQPPAATAAAKPATAGTPPAEPSAPAAETGTASATSQPPAAAAQQAAPEKKKWSQMGAAGGKQPKNIVDNYIKQFDEQELGMNHKEAFKTLLAIKNKLRLNLDELLTENKLNEHLISRNKKSNNSLTSEQVERMKLLAGIKK